MTIRKFYDEFWNIVEKEAAFYIDDEIYEDTLSGKGTVVTYSADGELLYEIEFSNIPDFKREGETETRYFHSDGSLKILERLKDGSRKMVTTFYANEKLKRKDILENDSLIIGKCYDQAGKELEHSDFIIMPEFPEGKDSLLTWIYSRIQYPEVAREAGIEGTVIVKFFVMKDGTRWI